MDAPRRKSYDTVVIGAGIIGLACAWRLARSGASVLVLERGRAGSGASGVAAGMLAPVTEADFGEEPLLRLNLAGRATWPSFAAELEELSAIGCCYRDSGALVVAADRDDAEELRRLHEFQRSVGLDAEWLPSRECRRLEPGLSPRIAGGILAPQDGHVDPAAVIAALGAALDGAGGELVEGADVSSLCRDGARVTGVRSSAGEVSAETVILAGGAWSGELAGAAAVRPVKGQILQLRRRRGGAPPPQRIVRTPRCYVVHRGDGRVVVGATVEEKGFDTAVTGEGVHRLLEAAWEVYPEVGELELVAARAGLRAGSPDNAPLIGEGEEEGLVWATGHHRNGVLLAPLTASAVTQLVTEGTVPDELSPFSPLRFAGEARRTPA